MYQWRHARRHYFPCFENLIGNINSENKLILSISLNVLPFFFIQTMFVMIYITSEYIIKNPNA